MCTNLKYTRTFISVQLKFQYMATRKQTDRQTYTDILQWSHASVGLAQAHPKHLPSSSVVKAYSLFQQQLRVHFS